MLPSRNRPAQDCPVPQRFGEDFRAFRIRGKATEQDILTVVYDNAGAFFSIIFFQLGEALDDRYHTDPTGTSCGKHHFHRFDFRDRSNLVRKQHDPVREFSPVLIRYHQHFSVKLL